MSNEEFKVAWQENDQQIEQDATAFWAEHELLGSQAKPEERVKRLVSVAYQDGKMAALSTASISPLESVSKKFAWLRVAVAPDLRRQGLMKRLVKHASDTLEEWSASHPGAEVCGIGVVMDLPMFNTGDLPAILEDPALTLAGYNEQDHKMYIYWFDHILI